MKGFIKSFLLGMGIVVFVLVLFSLVLMLLRPKPPRGPESVANRTELETYLQDLVDSQAVPGLSIAVVKNGEVVYSKGFGYADLPDQIPAASDTVYAWWSVSKIPTAVAVLQLHEQGLLDINDPVEEYLPFFQVTHLPGDTQPVTIQHLLNHSSGLVNNVPEVVGWIHHEDDPSVDQYLLAQNSINDYASLAFETGSKGVYTNVGYMILGALVQEVSGQRFEDYVEEHILEPLKMEHTGYQYNQEMISSAAAGSHPGADFLALLLPFFVDDFGSYVRERQDGRIWFNRFYADPAAPTGLIGPPTDIARFLMAYLNEGELDGERILSEQTVDMMTNQGHIESGLSPETAGYEQVMHGLGWFIVKEGGSVLFLEHGGGGPGFGTRIRLYPEQELGIVVMGNDTLYEYGQVLDYIASLEW